MRSSPKDDSWLSSGEGSAMLPGDTLSSLLDGVLAAAVALLAFVLLLLLVPSLVVVVLVAFELLLLS